MMDEKLAQIYGTGQATDANEDLQKTAAAELLVKLAEEQGIDLDKLSDAQVMQMVQELYKTAEDGPPPPFAKKEEGAKEEPKKETKGEESSGESSPDESKEAQAKFAEADYLGRVMAHAYVQELGRIDQEKQASQEKDAGKSMEFLKNIGKKAKEVAGKAGGHVAAQAKKPGVAAGAAGAAGLAGGFAAGRASKKKESSAQPSALDTLVQQRAYELAKEAGYVDAEGNLLAPPQAEEKQASVLDVAITKQALQLLEANGYPVEWNRA
jgi:hypothetical protein